MSSSSISAGGRGLSAGGGNSGSDTMGSGYWEEYGVEGSSISGSGAMKGRPVGRVGMTRGYDPLVRNSSGSRMRTGPITGSDLDGFCLGVDSDGVARGTFFGHKVGVKLDDGDSGNILIEGGPENFDLPSLSKSCDQIIRKKYNDIPWDKFSFKDARRVLSVSSSMEYLKMDRPMQINLRMLWAILVCYRTERSDHYQAYQYLLEKYRVKLEACYPEHTRYLDISFNNVKNGNIDLEFERNYDGLFYPSDANLAAWYTERNGRRLGKVETLEQRLELLLSLCGQRPEFLDEAIKLVQEHSLLFAYGDKYQNAEQLVWEKQETLNKEKAEKERVEDIEILKTRGIQEVTQHVLHLEQAKGEEYCARVLGRLSADDRLRLGVELEVLLRSTDIVDKAIAPAVKEDALRLGIVSEAELKEAKTQMPQREREFAPASSTKKKKKKKKKKAAAKARAVESTSTKAPKAAEGTQVRKTGVTDQRRQAFATKLKALQARLNACSVLQDCIALEKDTRSLSELAFNNKSRGQVKKLKNGILAKVDSILENRINTLMTTDFPLVKASAIELQGLEIEEGSLIRDKVEACINEICGIEIGRINQVFGDVFQMWVNDSRMSAAQRLFSTDRGGLFLEKISKMKRSGILRRATELGMEHRVNTLLQNEQAYKKYAEGVRLELERNKAREREQNSEQRTMLLDRLRGFNEEQISSEQSEGRNSSSEEAAARRTRERELELEIEKVKLEAEKAALARVQAEAKLREEKHQRALLEKSLKEKQQQESLMRAQQQQSLMRAQAQGRQQAMFEMQQRAMMYAKQQAMMQAQAQQQAMMQQQEMYNIEQVRQFMINVQTSEFNQQMYLSQIEDFVHLVISGRNIDVVSVEGLQSVYDECDRRYKIVLDEIESQGGVSSENQSIALTKIPELKLLIKRRQEVIEASTSTS